MTGGNTCVYFLFSCFYLVIPEVVINHPAVVEEMNPAEIGLGLDVANDDYSGRSPTLPAFTGEVWLER